MGGKSLGVEKILNGPKDVRVTLETATREAALFMNALSQNVGDDERFILCGFRGDPNEAARTAWRPRAWRPGGNLPFNMQDNLYITSGTFGQSFDKTWRRRKEMFKGGHAMMVDDVGTKVDKKAMRALKPSAIVETSQGNFQYWYFFREPERDVRLYEMLIQSFIVNFIRDVDPGMAGVTRVGRVPGFTNGKPKYDGWVCRLRFLDADRRFTPDELRTAFGLGPVRHIPQRLVPADAEQRIEAFITVRDWLDDNSMIKNDEPDMAGWMEIECPWLDEHTNRANSGAAIREPSPENGFTGAFKCHHGHCMNKGWRDLTDWINERAVEKLEQVNMGAF